MAFPSKLLTEGEKVLLDLRAHWKALVQPVFWTVLLWGAGGFLLFKLPSRWPSSIPWIAFAGIVGAWVLLAVIPCIQWLFVEYTLTDERLIARSGVLSKRAKEIPLERINDITFTQTFLERLFRSGDLVLESAGEYGQEALADIPDPAAVQKRIYEATEARKGLGRTPVPRGESVADELAKLADLRDRGVMTADEFDARKRALLDG